MLTDVLEESVALIIMKDDDDGEGFRAFRNVRTSVPEYTASNPGTVLTLQTLALYISILYVNTIYIYKYTYINSYIYIK